MVNDYISIMSHIDSPPVHIFLNLYVHFSSDTSYTISCIQIFMFDDMQSRCIGLSHNVAVKFIVLTLLQFTYSSICIFILVLTPVIRARVSRYLCRFDDMQSLCIELSYNVALHCKCIHTWQMIIL